MTVQWCFRLLLLVCISSLFFARPAFSQDAVARQVVVELKGGDLIHGRLASENDDDVILVSPVLGTITLSREKVISITDVIDGNELEEAKAKAKAEAEAAAKKKADEEAKKKAELEAEEKSPWSGSVNLGLTYSDATDTSTAINFAFALNKNTDVDKFSWTTRYFYSRESGEVSSNDIISTLDQTWLVKDSPWSYFAMGTYQWDQFQAWEHRVSPYGGIGYSFVQETDLTLTGRFGAGGTWEYQGDPQFDPQLLFQFTGNWTIDDTQSFRGNVQIAPEVTDFENYLFTVSADYKLKLGKGSPFSFNLSVLNIHDSQPTDGASKNDLKVVVSFGYDF